MADDRKNVESSVDRKEKRRYYTVPKIFKERLLESLRQQAAKLEAILRFPSTVLAKWTREFYDTISPSEKALWAARPDECPDEARVRQWLKYEAKKLQNAMLTSDEAQRDEESASEAELLAADHEVAEDNTADKEARVTKPASRSQTSEYLRNLPQQQRLPNASRSKPTTTKAPVSSISASVAPPSPVHDELTPPSQRYLPEFAAPAVIRRTPPSQVVKPAPVRAATSTTSAAATPTQSIARTGTNKRPATSDDIESPAKRMARSSESAAKPGAAAATAKSSSKTKSSRAAATFDSEDERELFEIAGHKPEFASEKARTDTPGQAEIEEDELQEKVRRIRQEKMQRKKERERAEKEYADALLQIQLQQLKNNEIRLEMLRAMCQQSMLLGAMVCALVMHLHGRFQASSAHTLRFQ
eukprot:TRINITY_DN14136_c0_g1_i1.p1 TRINITY_DN14136_c0_g1~~TRINITY_DN14136_c0_g1_i1.p1  ORF type:complete len:443 (+),score=87.29 TRINITY_DN14136_c0_g1_i1:87-1331(+)